MCGAIISLLPLIPGVAAVVTSEWVSMDILTGLCGGCIE